MATDLELLASYRAGSQAAFAELAARHLDWVYSAAKRRVRDAHLAEDVTQAVFLALAGKWRVAEGTLVSSWLFGVLRYTAAKALRDQSRRRRHELAASQQRQDTSGASEIWNDLAPILEEAVGRLRERERDAVILRFYRQCSFAEVGGALGLSDDTARKRVERAIRKLQRYFVARGIAVPEAALSGVLMGHCVQTAAAALNGAIAVVSAPSNAGSALFRATVRQMRVRLAWKIFGLAGIAAMVIVAVVAGLQLAAKRAAALPVAATQPASATQPLASIDPPTYLTPITLDQIIAGVKQSENVFQNVHVRNFLTTMDELPKGQINVGSHPRAISDDRVSPTRRYVTMEDGSQQETHVGSPLPNIRAGVATRPDGDSPDITRDPWVGW